MIKKLLLSATFLTTALFSGLNYSIYAQAANAVELETLNQGQVKNIIRVNSENELPKDGTTYTLEYSKQHCKLPDEPEKTSEVITGTSQNTTTVTSQEVTTTSSSTTETQKKTTESAPQTTTTFTTVLKNQVKQSLPQTGTQKSVTVVLTAGVLVALAFLMIKYHKKKVWMVLLITASVTSLYNLRNVMAQNETKVTTTTVTTFVPTEEYCLVGYILIPNTSETTKITTKKGTPEVLDKPEFKGGVPGMPETHEKPEFNGGVVPNEAPIHDKPSIEIPTTVGTATEPTVTSATTTTSTEPTTEATSAEPIFESSEVESTETTASTEATTESTEPTTTTTEASANN